MHKVIQQFKTSKRKNILKKEQLSHTVRVPQKKKANFMRPEIL